MAVDIKQLRIGSHVLLSRENKRVRIGGITKRKIGYHRRADKTDHLAYARLNEIEPIAITPELLVELGFEKTPDVNIWRKQYSQSILILRRHNHERWSCSVWQDGGCRAVMNFCRLHQFEYIIYLTLGMELIEE